MINEQMKEFLGEDFLLTNKVAEELYHDHAKNMPIIDYHNHLNPANIAEDRHFKDITEAWLEGDHYKWRAMRAFGIDESFVTGAHPSRKKFNKWAETVPHTMRNPLYHWTHLELRRYFGITDLLDSTSADQIFDETEKQLNAPEMGCRGLLERMNVEILCTTDDPADELQSHEEIAGSNWGIKVLPTFRPDKALRYDNPLDFKNYLSSLQDVSGIEVESLDGFLEVLQNRVDYFHDHGSRVSDLGFDTIPMINDSYPFDKLFKKLLAGNSLSGQEIEGLQAFVLLELCKMYHAKGWAQQFHLGALRNNNERGLRELGPDTGFDSMGDFYHTVSVSKFLNRLDNTDQLAKTILYNLNPRDNDPFATMTGNFQDGKTRGKIQFGTGWWFLDQKSGMEDQMNSLSNMGMLSLFIGMLTDSRSFLSFPRHEYFRRILCNLIGRDVVNGELPYDIDFLGSMVQDISFNNAKNYFEFESS